MLSFAMILMREMIAAAQPRRRRFDLAQHAVDAVADAQLGLGRLEVDVGGAHLDRPRDHRVDQADDRRLAGQVAQPFEIGFAVAVVALAGRVVHPVDRRAALGVEPFVDRIEIAR